MQISREWVSDILPLLLLLEEECLEEDEAPVEAVARAVAGREAVLKRVWEDVVQVAHGHCAPVTHNLNQQGLKPKYGP